LVSATATVQVEDVDDMPPIFRDKNGHLIYSLTANISENSPPGTPLQLSSDLTVVDYDVGENAVFHLTLSDFCHCLEVFPDSGQSLATVLIRVKDTACFDYEDRQAMTFNVSCMMVDLAERFWCVY
jgi:hypothetical protein